MTFPAESLEPLRYTVENGNGSRRHGDGERDGDGSGDEIGTGNEPMEVEDLEDKQSSLKRPLTPPITVDDQPPAKRSPTNENVEEQVKGQSETTDGTGCENNICDSVVETGEGVETCESNGEIGEENSQENEGVAGEADPVEPLSEPAVDLSQAGEVLPKNLPKVYDLFATCVS